MTTSSHTGRKDPRLVAYWICTALVACSFLSGGAVNALRVPQAVEGITRLGYPVHFIVLLGVWKVLGGLAVLWPGLPRLKEWAYAGMTFDLTGAAVAQAVAGNGGDAVLGGVGHVVSPLLLATLVIGSWALRPADRRLGHQS